MVAAFEERLAVVEANTSDLGEKVGEVVQGIEALESREDDLRAEMQDALQAVAKGWSEEVDTLKAELQA